MPPPTLDGIINLNKPPGKTSFQMVAQIRRLSGQRKVGHAGTLDPDATGVLPILIGQATRLSAFTTDSLKIYRAEIRFGSATTTYDASGEITQQGNADGLSLNRIETALDSFRGTIEQIPPMYSAIKQQGKPLYQLARSGIEVSRTPRTVHIYRFSVVNWQSPVLTVEVECSKGTYIRCLAHDLGQVLECGAHLSKLVRTQSGAFRIETAVSIAQIEDAFLHHRYESLLHPLDTVLQHLPAMTVDEAQATAIASGRHFSPAEAIQNANPSGLYRAYSADGRLLALVQFDPEPGLWHPEHVFIRQVHASSARPPDDD